MRRFLLLATLLCSSVLSADAGWVVERVSRTEGAAEATSRVTLLIARGRVKELHEDSTYFLWDLRRKTLHQVDPRAKTYSGGPIPKMIASVKTYLDRMRSELTQMTDEQREELARRTEGLPMPVPAPATPPSWTVKAGGKTATLAGRKAVLWEIYRDGTLFEQRWIAEGFSFGADLDQGEFARWSDELEGAFATGMGDSLPSGPAVDEFRDRGFLLRSVYVGSSARVVTEVVRIEERDIPESTFTLPVDYMVKDARTS
jgi:hypothetical protein